MCWVHLESFVTPRVEPISKFVATFSNFLNKENCIGQNGNQQVRLFKVWWSARKLQNDSPLYVIIFKMLFEKLQSISIEFLCWFQKHLSFIISCKISNWKSVKLFLLLLLCRPTACRGSWLEMITTARAPAENMQLWSPGIWVEEPLLSRALPESTVSHTVHAANSYMNMKPAGSGLFK